MVNSMQGDCVHTEIGYVYYIALLSKDPPEKYYGPILKTGSGGFRQLTPRCNILPC